MPSLYFRQVCVELACRDLQVAGVTCNISNLLQLVCNTDPPPRICDFDKEQIAAVFEARSWSRVVASMSVLARLKLLTPARRRRTDGGEADQQEGGDGEQQREEDDPLQGWVQSQARTVSCRIAGVLVPCCCCLTAACTCCRIA
jgi:hypothetical protein